MRLRLRLRCFAASLLRLFAWCACKKRVVKLINLYQFDHPLFLPAHYVGERAKQRSSERRRREKRSGEAAKGEQGPPPAVARPYACRGSTPPVPVPAGPPIPIHPLGYHPARPDACRPAHPRPSPGVPPRPSRCLSARRAHAIPWGTTPPVPGPVGRPTPPSEPVHPVRPAPCRPRVRARPPQRRSGAVDHPRARRAGLARRQPHPTVGDPP